MTTLVKKQIVEKFNKLYKESKCLFIIDYKGMNAEQTSLMRGELRTKCNTRMYVVKNTLNKKSTEGTDFASGGDMFSGQCAIIFCDELLNVSKVINKFCFVDQVAKLLGCMEGGKKCEESEIRELATLPSLEVLRTKLLYMLNSTGSSLVRTLNEAVNTGRKTDN